MARARIQQYSLVDTRTVLRERMYEINDKIKMYQQACDQFVFVSRLLRDTKVRYNRAKRNDQQVFVQLLSMRLTVIKGVKRAVYKVASKIANETDVLMTEFDEDFNIKWSEVSNYFEQNPTLDIN